MKDGFPTFAVTTVDERQKRCADMLAARGARVLRIDSCERLEGVSRADAILLPMPLTRDRATLAAEHGIRIPLDALVERIERSALVLCGMPTEDFSQSVAARGASLFDYATDERFLIENAYATAEGALCEVMRALDVCIVSADCAIVGYGRIARELHRLLRALGARRITVYARRRDALDEAERLGAAVCPIASEGLVFCAPHDAVLSTVPARIIPDGSLKGLRRGAILAELGSAPGSFDQRAAAEAGLAVLLLPSLPSRYAPRDAAGYMCRSALRATRAAGIDI